MEDTHADPNFTSDPPFSEAPLSRQAANDLREAAGDKVKQITQDTGVKTQPFKQTAVDKARQFREFADSKASDLKETASVKTRQIRRAADKQMQQSRVKACEAHANTEEYIRQHPTKSVLTALGIGFFIGLLIRR